jgi:hypothetical protein
MTLREDRNEQNKQVWRTHLEQERLDLSASVEAALIDDGVLSQHWQDEFAEEDDPQRATSRTGIVAPRFSLQSTTLPAVPLERFGTVTTDVHVVASSRENEERGQRSSGMLARLARRFTTTFTGINPSVKLEIPQQQGMVSDTGRSITQDTEAYQSMPDHRQLSAPVDYSDMPLVRVIDTSPSFAPTVETPPSQPQPKEHHSLRRNGKIRLQTTEQPAVSKSLQTSTVEGQKTGEVLLATDVKDTLSHRQILPILPQQREEQSTPSSTMVSSAIHTSPSGSGAFESEQSEVMVANTCITASSVVLVTLTTNPGPVVVQYISLQHEVGFTIHLTAPVAAHTTFNYFIV